MIRAQYLVAITPSYVMGLYKGELWIFRGFMEMEYIKWAMTTMSGHKWIVMTSCDYRPLAWELITLLMQQIITLSQQGSLLDQVWSVLHDRMRTRLSSCRQTSKVPQRMIKDRMMLLIVNEEKKWTVAINSR